MRLLAEPKKHIGQTQTFRMLKADSQTSRLIIEVVVSRHHVFLKTYEWDGQRTKHLFGESLEDFDWPQYGTRKEAIAHIRKFMSDNNLRWV